MVENILQPSCLQLTFDFASPICADQKLGSSQESPSALYQFPHFIKQVSVHDK